MSDLLLAHEPALRLIFPAAAVGVVLLAQERGWGPVPGDRRTASGLPY